MVAGQDQAEPRGPFSWGRLPEGRRPKAGLRERPSIFLSAVTTVTRRLPNAVVHRRFVFSLKSGFWLVRDQAVGLENINSICTGICVPDLTSSSGQENLFR